MHTLFISDLHLCAKRFEKVTLFIKFLKFAGGKVESIYILGDLFEVWAGSDDHTKPNDMIVSALNEYVNAGGKLFIMRGNRDFIMDKVFADKTGGQFLPDEWCISLYNQDILLMHGDTLCVDDKWYQMFRLCFNNIVMISLYKLLPYSIKFYCVQKMQRFTKNFAEKKQTYLINVSQQAVEKVMKKYNVSCLIHGHTHKQNTHEFTLNDQVAKRIVLGDWINLDSVLVADKSGFKFFCVAEYLTTFG